MRYLIVEPLHQSLFKGTSKCKGHCQCSRRIYICILRYFDSVIPELNYFILFVSSVSLFYVYPHTGPLLQRKWVYKYSIWTVLAELVIFRLGIENLNSLSLTKLCEYMNTHTLAVSAYIKNTMYFHVSWRTLYTTWNFIVPFTSYNSPK